MRNLKLNMQITLDGFVARPNGELDWMTLDFDDRLRADFNSVTASFDTILMGRKMTPEFMEYWTREVRNPKSPEYQLAKMMVEYQKIVFTKTLDKAPTSWPNTILAKGDLVDEVNRVKNQEGRDIVVYGGATFVSSLIKSNLIDEYYFFVNPVAIGNGMTIFRDLGPRFDLEQLDATPYECGVTVHKYLPAKARAASGA
jgi:dihydrofolate reductase